MYQVGIKCKKIPFLIQYQHLKYIHESDCIMHVSCNCRMLRYKVVHVSNFLGNTYSWKLGHVFCIIVCINVISACITAIFKTCSEGSVANLYQGLIQSSGFVIHVSETQNNIKKKRMYHSFDTWLIRADSHTKKSERIHGPIPREMWPPTTKVHVPREASRCCQISPLATPERHPHHPRHTAC